MLLVCDAFWGEPWGQGTLLATSEFPTSNHFLSYKLKQLEYILSICRTVCLGVYYQLNPHLSPVRLMWSIESPPPFHR